MMIKATELLESNPHPTLAQIKEAFTTSGRRPICAAAEPTLRSLKPYNMPPRSWRRGGKRWQPSAKNQRMFSDHAVAPRQFVKTGGALVVGFSLVGRSF
jgi:hypothetical protein